MTSRSNRYHIRWNSTAVILHRLPIAKRRRGSSDLVIIVGAAPCGRPGSWPSKSRQIWETGQAQGTAPTAGLSLPNVVNRFKTMTTKRYTDGVKQNGWPAFPGKLWQRNYYERVIRSDDELSAIREYITHNPQQWATDSDNPNNALVRGHQTMGNQLGQGNHGTQGNH